MGRLSIVGLPVSVFCQIARTIRSCACITSGLSGGYVLRKNKILSGIIQHEYPGLLSMKAFDLASDTLVRHEALLSLINNKHIFHSLEMEDKRLVSMPPY